MNLYVFKPSYVSKEIFKKNTLGLWAQIRKALIRFIHELNFVFQLDTEPDDPIKFLKSVEEEKKKEKERIARNVSFTAFCFRF